MGTSKEQIAKRRSDMPKSYRGIYDRAMSGKSRVAAVHAFCLECMGWEREGVRLCTSPACPFYLYRPYKKAKGADKATGFKLELTNAAK